MFGCFDCFALLFSVTTTTTTAAAAAAADFVFAVVVVVFVVFYFDVNLFLRNRLKGPCAVDST